MAYRHNIDNFAGILGKDYDKMTETERAWADRQVAEVAEVFAKDKNLGKDFRKALSVQLFSDTVGPEAQRAKSRKSIFDGPEPKGSGLFAED